MINQIATSQDLKKETSFHLRTTFQVVERGSNAHVINQLRQQMAAVIAEKLLANQKFFKLTIKDGYGELLVDVVAMNVDDPAACVEQVIFKFWIAIPH